MTLLCEGQLFLKLKPRLLLVFVKIMSGLWKHILGNSYSL